MMKKDERPSVIITPEMCEAFLKEISHMSHGGEVDEYPLRDHHDWEEAHDYEKTGGVLHFDEPEHYLHQVKPLNMDHEDKELIHHFEDQIKHGEKLDPVAIYPDGHPNGRHRAHAAENLGIKKIPVVTWSEKSAGGKIKKIKNLKGVKVEQPRLFYRGTNPESKERISTGKTEWDSHLFAADNPESASLYGRSIEKIMAKPEAKIIYEGTNDWNKIAGKWRKNESMLDYATRAAAAARQAGYDAAWFKRQSDIGTPIFNRENFIRNYDPSSQETGSIVDRALMLTSKKA